METLSGTTWRSFPVSGEGENSTAEMGLMRGRAPIRRTIGYLKSSQLFLKPNLKIMMSNIIPNHPASYGLQYVHVFM